MALLGWGFRKLIAERSAISACLTNAVIAHSIGRPQSIQGKRSTPSRSTAAGFPDRSHTSSLSKVEGYKGWYRSGHHEGIIIFFLGMEKKCRFCPRVCHKQEHLDRHERTHTKVRPYRCDKCEKHFVRRYFDIGDSYLISQWYTQTTSKTPSRRCAKVW